MSANELKPDEAGGDRGPAMLRGMDLQDAIEAADRKRTRLRLASAVAILIVAWVLFEAPPGAAFAVAVLALLSAKKAWQEYRLLAEEKWLLLQSGLEARETDERE